MQIFVENIAGKQLMSAENSEQNLLLYNNRLLIVLGDDESVRITQGDCESSFSKAGEYLLPIVWDRSNKCSFTIRQDKGVYKYQFQLDNTVVSEENDIINLLKFVSQLVDTFYLERQYKITELFEAIKDDKVSLIIEKTPYSGYDDQSLIKKISETIPMVMDICSHPKQSLKSEEAIQDVNLVKRINSRSMDYLASHSEHWKARTLNGLIPNRLRADIFEDEINIYENLFFRMAVNDVLKYVHRQVVSIEKTIQQNDNAIDWNAYGEILSDYKRMRIFRQLLPDYDVNEHQTENQILRNLLNQWKKLEKNFSTVEAAKFYRSIDKKKHISRNIQPTNILKKDSRYNALYRLWCEIQRQVVQEQQDSVNIKGVEKINIANCYALYVSVLILFVFKLLECELDEKSNFVITSEGSIIIDAVFRTDAMTYVMKSEKNEYGTLEIKVTFVEKMKCEHLIPQNVLTYIADIRKEIPEHAILDESTRKIIFYTLPTAAEQKALKNVFHLNNFAKKNMDAEQKYKYKMLDQAWRPELDNLFASGKIQEARQETIVIRPQFVELEKTEAAVEKYTNAVLDTAEKYTVYTFPIDIGEYRKALKSPKVASRLLNYGEKYFEGDADKWGDYHVGIIPTSQSEINSAQRLMKLISLHASRLQIKWNSGKTICPICGSTECKEESKNNWQCRNPECSVIFGITKHAGGCGARYEWTRPFVDIRKKDIQTSNYVDLMLRKEIIFDRLTITDFEFEEQADDRIKYIPICPKCGKRAGHK